MIVDNTCKCLPHPFQHDPGISQQQRAMEDLLAGRAQIDARKMADLLDYFYQLSRNINFYDAQLNISDWQPFFAKSVPFVLANVIRYNSQEVRQQFELFRRMFQQRPTAAGLQLAQYFIYYNTIHRIHHWYASVKGSELPVERVFEGVMKDKIRPLLVRFIGLNRIAATALGIATIDFRPILSQDVWSLPTAGQIGQQVKDLERSLGQGAGSDLLQELHAHTIALFDTFFEPIKLLGKAAGQSLDRSFDPLQEDLKKKHLPHLALLFAFLKLFGKLQADLNGFTKKHLDYFYRTVLQIKPRAAVPDSAHIIVEIQKELANYRLPKGLLVKDGKDVNKQEILFGLDDEIVVNKAQVKDIRALFLNNRIVPGPQEQNLLEGVYVATNLTKADGVDKDFMNEPKNYPTVGAKHSKYGLPGTKDYKPYPNSRLGFILASPVLLLREGKRTIEIILGCRLNEAICDAAPVRGKELDCDGKPITGGVRAKVEYRDNVPIADMFSKFPEDLEIALNSQYYYVSETLIAAAVSKGLTEELAGQLRSFLEYTDAVSKDRNYCQVATSTFLYDRAVPADVFEGKFAIGGLDTVQLFFKKRKPFSLLFSGEKGWVSPGEVPETTFRIKGDPGNFVLIAEATLTADKEAVTFYDKEKLKEDFNTTLPLVKIELDDHFKYALGDAGKSDQGCCLKKELADNRDAVSLYHFFRHVVLDDTTIKVAVCGLRNFVVQNDESVMDVNGPVYPFGVRPKVNSNFYIGSEEVFLKPWEKLWVNVMWKGKPKNLTDHYLGYKTVYRNGDGAIIETVDEVKEDKFLIKAALLQDGNWFIKNGDQPCDKEAEKFDLMFPSVIVSTDCQSRDEFYKNYSHQYYCEQLQFKGAGTQPRPTLSQGAAKKFDVNSRDGFLRVSLQCQDFRHDLYPIVLARQLAAESKLTGKDPGFVDGAVYYNIKNKGDLKTIDVRGIFNKVVKLKDDAEKFGSELGALIDIILSLIPKFPLDFTVQLNDHVWQSLFQKDLPDTGTDIDELPADQDEKGESVLYKHFEDLLKVLREASATIGDNAASGVVMPKEPWTPTISNISIDYSAKARKEDISLIHLYPFSGTYKEEVIAGKSTLLPTYCDEGTLFLGLENLVPGTRLNILFQLAEATADSESEKEDVHWHYLESNVWKPLRPGFEVLKDETEDLTTSGIVEFALPVNMNVSNTIMPKDFYWIKASLPKNSRSVSETIGIHAQAIRATFTNTTGNDKLRLSKPIEANQIAKLETADAAVKKIIQPYETFGGRVPEETDLYYARVSELLRHKGRSIQKFDYERLVLDAFPQVFKAKCINHSLALDAHRYENDYPHAPGHVLLAVIPDLLKLKAGNAEEPRVPVSLLEKIDAFIKQRTSPFVRFKSMNPRYEKIHLCLQLVLVAGKDPVYYKEKLQSDIHGFLAPWSVGDPYNYKLTFGQCVHRSNIIGFLESLDYVDYIVELRMRHESDAAFAKDATNDKTSVCPATPRSILIAGDIKVCIPKKGEDAWGQDTAGDRSFPFIDCKKTANP